MANCFPPSRSDESVVPCLALRPREAAKALGICERKLWELTADRTSGIPHIRLGRVIRVPRRGLEEWIERQAGLPSAPSEGVDFLRQPAQRH